MQLIYSVFKLIIFIVQLLVAGFGWQSFVVVNAMKVWMRVKASHTGAVLTVCVARFTLGNPSLRPQGERQEG